MNHDHSNGLKVNIACGATYIKSWINLDYNPHSLSVKRTNLLSRLPIDDGLCDIVYTSHFLEHIPRKIVKPFLSECRRLLRPSGTIRIVTPDLQKLCQEYLHHREAGEHDKADFVILLILDQCVRMENGGDLGRLYRQLPHNIGTIANYVFQLTGNRVKHITQEKTETGHLLFWTRLLNILRHPGKILNWMGRKYINWWCHFLPAAFREQNVSLTSVGERHMWLYDFATLEQLLSEAGFADIVKLSFEVSRIDDFPLIPLDMTTDGAPRKGLQSMYVEARKHRQ